MIRTDMNHFELQNTKSFVHCILVIIFTVVEDVAWCMIFTVVEDIGWCMIFTVVDDVA